MVYITVTIIADWIRESEACGGASRCLLSSVYQITLPSSLVTQTAKVSRSWTADTCCTEALSRKEQADIH